MPKNMMAWSYRKNARHRNPKKDVVRKAVCNKTKKTKNEMAGECVHGPEKDGCKRMERQSKELRSLEAYCRGGQSPPRAVVPFGVDGCGHPQGCAIQSIHYKCYGGGGPMRRNLHSRKKRGKNYNYRRSRHNKAVWEKRAGIGYNVFT
jgi:hypothetical protein